MEPTRFFIFLIVSLCLFLSKSGFAQQTMDSLQPMPEKRLAAYEFSVMKERTALLTYHATTIPADNYCRNLAFFCRQEVKIEKAIKVPFRFRIGSLEQCNKLEGK